MLEQNTLVAVATMFAGIGGGVGLVAWTEQQGARTITRPNTQVCTACLGEKVVVCTVCGGSGKDPLDENEVCSYCDGEGTVTCFNCGGTGIQPRFLDRYVYCLFVACVVLSAWYRRCVLTCFFCLCLLQIITRGFHGLILPNRINYTLLYSLLFFFLN